MPTPIIVRDEIHEGQDFGFTMFRFVGGDGETDFTGGDVTNVTLNVYDLDSDTPNTAVYTNSNVTSAVVALQIGSGWTKDDVGFNFRHWLSVANVGASNINGGHTYALEYTLTTDAYDGSAGNWGPMIGVRHCRVLSRGSS
jgi:hypothetical protein